MPRKSALDNLLEQIAAAVVTKLRDGIGTQTAITRGRRTDDALAR